MSALTALPVDALLTALGWALLHALWSGTAIALLAALVLRLMRGASPQLRYLVCAGALATCVLLPALHVGWLLQPRGQWPAAPALLPASLQWLLPQLPLLTRAWAVGVGLMGARLALGLCWVARLRHAAGDAPPEWQQRLNGLATRVGLRRPVRLALLPAPRLEPDGPVTVGTLKPLVLLPAALLSRLPVPLVEALIAHELAHVRRWDYLANLAQSVAEALLFFHPAVWWLSSRLRQERELVADALAAEALGGDGHRLAVALDALAGLDANAAPQPVRLGRAPRASLALAARGGKLLRRVELLMHRPARAGGWQQAWPAALLAGVALVAQAVVSAEPPVQAPSTASATAAPAATLPADAAPVFSALKLVQLPVHARHMVVVDDSGQVLMAKDADTVVPIASLTKLMTAIVVLDAQADPREWLRIEPDDVDRRRHGFSHLPAGARLARGAALELSLLASDNGATAALARSHPGGRAAFDAALQAKIHALGLAHTTLHDPTGLSLNNTSSAADIARITMAAARYPEIARITGLASATIAVDGREREWHNTNRLVGGQGWDIQLSKTGYTAAAGRCLAMRLRSGERTLTVVLLNTDNPAQRSRDATAIRQALAQPTT